MGRFIVRAGVLMSFAAFTTIGSSAANAAPLAATFEYTGAAQTYVVPAGVTRLRVEAWGAQGGIYDGSDCDSGGFGGYVLSTIAVTPGETLTVTVGGRGSDFGDTDIYAGGYNGGGRGASNAAGGSRGGGGASDVRRAPFELDDRLVVAAGGGGAGSSSSSIGGSGGAAGGAGAPAPYGGGGGTPTAGGAAGTSGENPASAGSLGVGGDGGNQFNGLLALVAGGGGGGGRYGGGGGAGDSDVSEVAGGGGGGSSFGPAGSVFTSGVNGRSGQCSLPALDGRILVTPTASAGTFHPLAPQRILDTREGLGATSTKVAAGGTVELDVAGHGGVPTSGVAAVALNVTVAEPAAPGYITAYPCVDDRPFASNGNYAAGQAAGSAALVAMAGDGTICIYTLASAHLIVDVSGWIATDGAPIGSRFNPVPPDRLLDTRDGSILQGGTELELPIPGRQGVPSSGVSAATLNLTVTEPTGPGFLTAYPCGQDRPTVSNVNYAPGQTVANLATVKLGTGGRICIYALTTTHVIADVAGWYGDAGAPTGSVVTPVAPERNLDSRVGIGAPSGPLPANGELQLIATGRTRIPSTGVTAVVLSVAVTDTTGPGYLTVYPCDVDRPTASNVNYGGPGETVANLVVVKLDPAGRYCVFSPTTTHVLADVAGYLSTSAG